MQEKLENACVHTTFYAGNIYQVLSNTNNFVHNGIIIIECVIFVTDFAFLTHFQRFLRSSNLGKKYWGLETCRKN